MKEERENITRNNTEQYPRFIWNYEKEEEEEEKNDMDKRLAKTREEKGAYNVISDCNRIYSNFLITRHSKLLR